MDFNERYDAALESVQFLAEEEMRTQALKIAQKIQDPSVHDQESSLFAVPISGHLATSQSVSELG
jgi:hypothetical protein